MFLFADAFKISKCSSLIKMSFLTLKKQQQQLILMNYSTSDVTPRASGARYYAATINNFLSFFFFWSSDFSLWFKRCSPATFTPYTFMYTDDRCGNTRKTAPFIYLFTYLFSPLKIVVQPAANGFGLVVQSQAAHGEVVAWAQIPRIRGTGGVS